MAIARGLSLGQIDPVVLDLRDGYVAYRDRSAQHWHTPENAARWAAERDLWLDGETMICSTEEMFSAAMAAGMPKLADSFTHRHDPDQQRRWQVPGRDGGPVVEVAVQDGQVVVLGPVDPANSVPLTRSEIARKGGNTRWQNSHS